MGRTNDELTRTAKNGTRGSGKTSPYISNRTGRSVDWSSVDGDVLSECISAVTDNGDALLLGRSMDGGVLVLTVCAGSERIKFYAREGLEMTAHMQGIISQLGQQAGRI